MSSLSRRIVVAIAGLAVFCLLVFAAVHLPVVRMRVLSWTAARLAASYGLKLTADRLDYNLLTLSVTAHGVTLAAVDQPESPLFQADALRARLPWSALAGVLSLESLEIDRPRISIVRDRQGVFNLPSSPSTGGGGPERFRVDRLMLRDLAFQYHDLARDMAVDVARVSIDMEPDGRGAIAGPLSSNGTLGLRVGDSSTTTALAGRLGFDGATVALTGISLTGPEGVLTFDGHVASVLGDPSLDLQYKADVDLNRAATWSPVAQRPTGRLIATGRILGPTSALRLTTDVTASAVEWLGVTDIDVRANVDLSTEALALTRADIRFGSGEVSASGRIPFAAAGPMEAHLSWMRVDAEQLLPMLPDTVPPLAAALAGKLDFQWSGSDRQAIRIAVTNRSAPLSAGPREIPIGGDLTVLIENGRWRATHDHEIPGAANVSGVASGTVGETWEASTIAGDLNVASTNLAALAGVLARAQLLPDGSAEGLSGEMDLMATLSGRVGAPVVQGTIAGRSVHASGFGPLVLDGAFALDRRRVEVQGLEARTGSNLATLDAMYVLGSGAIDGRVTGQLERLDEITSVNPAWRPTGALNFDLQLGGSARRPRFEGTFAGRDLAVAAQRLVTAGGAIRFENQIVAIDNLELAQAGPGRLSGNVSYDLRTQAFSVKLDGQQLAITPLPAGVISAEPLELSAIADVQVDAHGTRADPMGTGRIAFSALDVAGSHLGAPVVGLTFRDGAAWIDGAVTELALAVNGRVALVEPYEAQLKLQFTDASLERLAALAPSPTPGPAISGTTTLTVSASGPLESWSDLVIEGNIAAFDARIDEHPIVLTRPARFGYRDNEITAEDLEFGAGMARVALAGRLSRLNDAGRITATIVGPLDDLMPFIRLAGAPADVMARGVVDAKVDVAGTINRPVMAGTFSLDNGDLVWSSFSASGLTARGSLQDGVVRMDTLTGYWQGASIDGAGVVPLRLMAQWLPASVLEALPPSPGAATVRLRVDHLTAAAMSPWLSPETATELDGTMTFTLEGETDRLELAAFKGTLIVEDALLSFSRVPLVQELPTHITLTSGRAEIEASRWSGAGTVLVVSGSVGPIGANPELDLRADGSVDLRLLTAFMANTATGGLAEVRVRVQGPLMEPEVTGRVDLQNAEVRLREPRLALSELNGVITLAEDRVVFDGLRGFANGGDVEIRGEMTHRALTLVNGKVVLSARGVGIEYPEGLRSRLDGDLVLNVAAEGDAILTGKVTIERGAYRRRLSLTQQLLSGGGPTIVETGPVGSRLGAIRLDIAVVTAEDLVFDNNYGRLEMGADLRLTGTIDRPALGGRATIREGGEIYLGGNTYLIDRGFIDFVNPSRIEPTLDLSARTLVSGYEITMNISGVPGAIETNLVSDPPLGREDVVSLLLTGRTLDQAGSEQSDVAQEQLLGLLSGEVLSAAGSAVGLDRVRFERGVSDDTMRIDPGFVATEANPAARLTIAKNLRRDVEIVLSRDLRDGDLTWIASYQPRRRVEIRAITRDNNDRSYEFTQDLSFGGPPTARRVGRAEEQQRVSEVRFAGEPGFPPAELSSRVRLNAGDRFDFYRWQDDQDRLLRFYHERDYFEAKVRGRRTADPERPGELILEYTVTRGPATRLVVEGVRMSGGVLDDMREAWTRSVFDEFLLDDMRMLVSRWLIDQGYLQASVDARIAGPITAEKTIAVKVETGPKTEQREVTFSGNMGIDSGELRDFVRARALQDEGWINRQALSQAITELYRSRGWLAAEARVDEPLFEGSRATLPVTITEGPAFTIAETRLVGVSPEREAAVREALGFSAAVPYEPAKIEAGRAAVEAHYRLEGFSRATTAMTAAVDRAAGTVTLTLNVKEGVKQILASVSVMGAERTNRNFLMRALKLEVGSPVNQNEWAQARKRLYDTAVFRRVEIEAVPVEAASSIGGGAVAEERVEAKVTLEEVATWRFRYGLQVNHERAPVSDAQELGPGFTANLEKFNLFGRAAKAGLAFRYDQSNRIGRTYFVTPRFFGRPITSSIFLSRARERFGDEGFLPFITDRWQVTAEQRFRPRRRIEVSYAYQFERNRTFDPNADPDDPFALDIRIRVARLNSTTTWDTRDDPFNATRGWFHSSSFEYAPEGLGSDLRFMKYLAQQYFYRVLTSKLVFASALRIGFADAFGQELIPSERFFAGGGNSVRGYREDSLGGFDAFGDPIGGTSLLVLNEEARFPIYRWVNGVGFLDAGNVFQAGRDISFADLKVGVGFGLRIDTPFALIRLDYGVPMSNESGERQGRWFLSIGQAF